MRARPSDKRPKQQESALSSGGAHKRASGRAIARVGLLSGVVLGMTPSDVMATIVDFSGVPLTLAWGTSAKANTSLNLDSSTNSLGYSQNLVLSGSHKFKMNKSIGFVSLAAVMGMNAVLNALTTGSGYVRAIATGALIGSAGYSNFTAAGNGLPFLNVSATTGSTSVMGTVPLSSSFYFGFQFFHMSTLVNAWARAHISGSTVGGAGPFPFNLTLWAGAFEDSGGSIAAGAAAITEPDTAGLTMLGLGALGVHALRRRKRERQHSTKRADAASA